MKKNLFVAGLIAIAACGVIGTSVMAEDDIFGDLNAKAPESTDLTTTVKVEQPVVIRGTSEMSKTENLTNQSLQNTISSLDSAQNDLKVKLETAQTNYDAVNQEYLRAKQERAALRKIVRKTNSRIKSLERTKKSIMKNMQSDL